MKREKPAPCKGCEKRRTMCHAMCIEYAAWCYDHREIVREREKEHSEQSDFLSILGKRKERLRKKGVKK